MPLYPAAARRRPGKVAVLVALCLPAVILPTLALGVDAGLLMDKRRQAQAAVDAAALAAAVQLYRDNPIAGLGSGVPLATAEAQQVALNSLAQHGFTAANCDDRTVSFPAS